MPVQAFDTYALRYDEHFTNSLIGKTQRAQVHQQLNKLLVPKTKTLLELTCGTGEDAVWLADKGLRVTATDISEGMLEVARRKIKKVPVEFRHLKTQDIASLVPEKYDLIFSNFGGLNCLSPEELVTLADSCAELQKSGDRLVFVIMSKNCWWEKFYYRFKRDSVKAERRSATQGYDTEIDGVKFKTYYYSPGEISRLFAKQYTTKFSKPIGLFVPPSYLESYFKKRRGLFGVLSLLDKVFSELPVFSNNADHFLIVLEKP